MNARIVLRNAASGVWLHFADPHQIISAQSLADVLPALREIERLVDENGWHAAGFISYEAAPAFDSAFSTRPASALPLLWFGLYSEPLQTPTLADSPGNESGYTLGDWLPSVRRETYNAAIAQVKDHIARGKTYQVNYTFRLKNQFRGNPFALFAQMVSAQPVAYPAYVETERHILCSVSPELFFCLDGDTVTCRPMKGTVKRGRTLAEDEAQAAWLQASEKNRAENVMIVDMIRNDLGRIAKIGTVRVPELFTAERYRTLWQMTSTVTAEVKTSFADLMTALFPCASITGAPKVSTMNIIAALESTPRGVYTGCIGYLAPGRVAQFNVAIRTVTIEREQSQAEYGVGGGIVWDSTAESEYDEALLKARVITEKHPAFDLLETLRWTPAEGFFLLEGHLRRLRDSAIYFGFAFDREKTVSFLQNLIPTFPAARRVRLLLKQDGTLTHQTFALAEHNSPLRVKFALEPVNSNDIFLFHKTTQREIYEKARATCPDCDDVLLYNERGELTEFTIGNLVAELDGELVTPPISCGLLAGTFRAHLLEGGQIREKVLTRAEIAQGAQLFLVNSVRGWQKVEIVSKRTAPLADSPSRSANEPK